MTIKEAIINVLFLFLLLVSSQLQMIKESRTRAAFPNTSTLARLTPDTQLNVLTRNMEPESLRF